VSLEKAPLRRLQQRPAQTSAFICRADEEGEYFARAQVHHGEADRRIVHLGDPGTGAPRRAADRVSAVIPKAALCSRERRFWATLVRPSNIASISASVAVRIVVVMGLRFAASGARDGLSAWGLAGTGRHTLLRHREE